MMEETVILRLLKKAPVERHLGPLGLLYSPSLQPRKLRAQSVSGESPALRTSTADISKAKTYPVTSLYETVDLNEKSRNFAKEVTLTLIDFSSPLGRNLVFLPLSKLVSFLLVFSRGVLFIY